MTESICGRMGYPQKDSESKSHPFTPIPGSNKGFDFDIVMTAVVSGWHDI